MGSIDRSLVQAAVEAGLDAITDAASRAAVREAVLADQPDTMALALSKPVEFGGEMLAELNLKEPTAGQLEQISAVPSHQAGIKAVSLSAGVPEKVIRDLSARDFKRAENFVLTFI